MVDRPVYLHVYCVQTIYRMQLLHMLQQLGQEMRRQMAGDRCARCKNV